MFSPLTDQLIEALCGLPSVGPKSAQRMAFHLLAKANRSTGSTLAKALAEAIDQVDYCHSCRNFSEHTYCPLCQSEKRNRAQICVVETPADLAAIEATGVYSGMYYVLHGRLSPLDGIGPEDIALPALLERIDHTQVEEVILATNPTVEGRATAHYIASRISPGRTQCSRIAHGVPLGGELEYLDRGTLHHALESRDKIET